MSEIRFTFPPTNQQTTEREVVMSDRNIHNGNLQLAAQHIEAARRTLEEQMSNNTAFHSLEEQRYALTETITVLERVDTEWHEILETEVDEPLDMSGNWDVMPWYAARDGDRIMLRDPAARDNGGPVYVIDGVPAYRSDHTMSVMAELIGVAGNRWNWPNGPALMEFCQECWQVWRDFDNTEIPLRTRVK